MDTVSKKVVDKIRAMLTQGPIEMRCQRDANGNLLVPRSATAQIALEFTIPELREAGAQVVILTEDGRPMTDDEYAAAVQAEIKQHGR